MSDVTDVPVLVSLAGVLEAAQRRETLVLQKDRRQSSLRKVVRASGRRGMTAIIRERPPHSSD